MQIKVLSSPVLVVTRDPFGYPVFAKSGFDPAVMIREQVETLASPVGRSGRGARRRRAARVARVFGTSETAVWADAHARGCESDATS